MFNHTYKIVLTLGVGAISVMGASGVSAQQAYISGSSTLVLMNGASQSIGGEISVPNGIQIPGPVTVTPTYQGTTPDLSENQVTFSNATGLSVSAGAADSAPAGSSFTAAAAAKLNAAIPLDEVVSIIRAGAGVDGLD